MYRNFQCVVLSKYKHVFHQNHRTVSKIRMDPIPTRGPLPPTITVMGANSNMGKISAMLFKTQPIFKRIILYDNSDTSGAAADLNCINTIPKAYPCWGVKNLADAIIDAQIVYICGGIKTFPGLSEKDMFIKNVAKVRQIIMYLSEINPRAMVVLLTPPASCLVPMAIQEFRKNDILADKQVFGVTTIQVLRTKKVLSKFLKVPKSEIDCPIICGSEDETMLPIFGAKVRDACRDDLVKDIQTAEDDVLVQKLADSNKHGCYLSLAYSGVKFTLNLAEALFAGKKDKQDSAFVKIGTNRGRFSSCIVTFDEEGVKSTFIPKLLKPEKVQVYNISTQLKRNIEMGEHYVTGNEVQGKFRPKRKTKTKKGKGPKKAAKRKEEELCKKRKTPKTLTIFARN